MDTQSHSDVLDFFVDQLPALFKIHLWFHIADLQFSQVTTALIKVCCFARLHFGLDYIVHPT